jgi:hypothetical protein
MLVDAELDFSVEESELNIRYNAQGKLMAASFSMLIKKLTSPDNAGRFFFQPVFFLVAFRAFNRKTCLIFYKTLS